MKNLTKLELLKRVEKGELTPQEAFQEIKKMSAAFAADNKTEKKITKETGRTLKEIVKEELIKGITATLNIPKEKINTECNVKEYGFDSISFTGYNNYISENLKIDLSPNIFLENETVSELCDYICKEYTEPLMALFRIDSAEVDVLEEKEQEAKTDAVQEEVQMEEVQMEEVQMEEIQKEANNKMYLVESSNNFPDDFWTQDMKKIAAQGFSEMITQEEYKKNRNKYVHLLVETSAHKKMEVLSSGKGETIVLMGGVGMAAPLAKKQIEYFSKDYRVLYIHNPGCGLSEDLDEYTLEARVQVVIEILDQLGIQEAVHFAGISWGGLIGQQMSVMYPDKVSSLILLSSIYEIEEEKKGVTADEAMKNEIQATSEEEEYIELLEKGSCIDNEVFVKYMKYYLPGSDKTYKTYDILPKIKVPVLVIYGAEDSIVSTSQSQIIYDKVQNGTIAVIKNAGHFHFLTHHEEVNKRIEQFLYEVTEVKETMSLKPYVREISAMQKKWEKELNIKGLEEYEGLEDSLNRLCASYVYEYFKQCDVDTEVGKIYDINSLAKKLNILPAYKKLYLSMIQMLKEDKIIRVIDTKMQFIKDEKKITKAQNLYESCMKQYSEFQGMLEFLNYCVSNYKKALCGQIMPISVLFPKGSSEALEKSNQNTVEYGKERIYAMLVHDLILKLASMKEEPLRILEVGGGTGLLTRQVADAVEETKAEYYFTDIGEYFIKKAQQEPKFKTFQFKIYDISKDPTEQGLERGSFDLVIGINVVHATQDIADTIAKVKTLLNASGTMMIIEASKNYRWVDLVWGLTEGWWLYNDYDIRKTSPIINIYEWKRIFEQAGFKFVKAYPEETKKRFDTNCSFIIGQQ